MRIAPLAFVLVPLVIVGLTSPPGHLALAQPAPVCGDTVLEPPEECDDGNLLDGDGCSASCEIENAPPECDGAEPSVGELWPPNHKLVSVAVLGVTDPDGDPVAITVTGVAQDEPLDGTGDGATCPDAAGVGTAFATLRAERSGNGDGRVYHVVFAAEDGRGGACTGAIQVCVPHDRGRGATCGDQGPLFDAAGAPPACEGEDCGPEDCVPPPDTLTPSTCGGTLLPRGVVLRTARGRALLGRLEDAGTGRRRRLIRRAARQLRRAARAAGRAGRRGRLDTACGDALAERLDEAAACTACVPDDPE